MSLRLEDPQSWAIGDFRSASPVEQQFALVWELMAHVWEGKHDERFPGVLIHQYAVETDRKSYRVDFRVGARAEDGEVVLTPFVIEIEGHDYHERTKGQVIRDNERERALERAGLHVIRFSGAEVFHGAARCVDEALDTIETIGPRFLAAGSG